MRRYYICDLVQDSRGRWVPALKSHIDANEPTASMSVVSSGIDASGHPVTPWCMVVLEARDHAAVGALSGVNLMPDFPLDAKVGSMHAATKAAMRAMLVGRGVSGTVTDNADGFRDIINGVARANLGNDGFDADSFNP